MQSTNNLVRWGDMDGASGGTLVASIWGEQTLELIKPGSVAQSIAKHQASPDLALPRHASQSWPIVQPSIVVPPLPRADATSSYRRIRLCITQHLYGKYRHCNQTQHIGVA